MCRLIQGFPSEVVSGLTCKLLAALGTGHGFPLFEKHIANWQVLFIVPGTLNESVQFDELEKVFSLRFIPDRRESFFFFLIVY